MTTSDVRADHTRYDTHCGPVGADSTFDLRTEVRGILDSTDLTEPGEIADKVLAGVPRDQLAAVLRQTLRPFVANMINTERVRAVQTSGTDHQVTDTQYKTVGAGTDLDRGDADQGSDDSQSAHVGAPRSWKRDLLRQRIHVGEDRKFLGDCTVADITAASVERVAVAKKNQVWADRYSHLARRMEQFHADTVREMPYDTVAAILRGGPA